ncbi:SURF1 family protein [Devosia albogilva]|uniref:SURF1-like protein n=1 Tax=Devosia albogilva TaxID=429726 RepID=A0ABW5QME8_9HYPH
MNHRAGTIVFAALMLALTALCLWLGTWQMQRLAEKEALIAAVDSRLDAEPVPVPAVNEWASFDAEAMNYQPVALTGTFRYSQTVTVFTSLADARGVHGGVGYWVVTPFVLAEGGTVFVNRGFVPQEFQEAAVTDGGPDEPQVTITGLLRPAEGTSFLTPAPNTSDRIDFVRDPERLAEMVDPALAPFAPFYVDMPAGAPGELPQGGETVITFPNNHLGYAITWYGFAVVAVVMLGFWLWRQRRDGAA